LAVTRKAKEQKNLDKFRKELTDVMDLDDSLRLFQDAHELNAKMLTIIVQAQTELREEKTSHGITMKALELKCFEFRKLNESLAEKSAKRDRDDQS